ncbi:phosphodiester glycosidase family protein [Qipengyuania thermophila]|uniref:phosphodiester glycosidase family protein n=1 Tax=Qipengyuania thermophila TaxID=2509361 RepID=UPI001F301302|nr:phosphodiester glycosidase family protein [Qipengyuania thermophila]
MRTTIRADAEGAVSSSEPANDVPPPLNAQVESSCRPIIFENTPFTHCLAVPDRHRITTALNGPAGPLRGFEALAASRAPDAPPVAFAINGGSFDDQGVPVGYFVEASQRLQPLNTETGEGDFFMTPNGVFFGSGEKWEVRTTTDFLANVSQRPEFGTQSGPMLVIAGRLHPRMAADGPDRLVRSAVGTDKDGRAHFVISNAPVSFGKLARLYRDKLAVSDALHLDGPVSALWSPANGRLDAGAPLGPMIVVERRQESGE